MNRIDEKLDNKKDNDFYEPYVDVKAMPAKNMGQEGVQVQELQVEQFNLEDQDKDHNPMLSQKENILNKNGKRKFLKWWDLLILSIILFGEATYNSILAYFSLLEETSTIEEMLTFTSSDNWEALFTQLFFLVIALLYLWFRKYDFSQWKIKINLMTIVHSLWIFAFTALTLDIFSMFVNMDFRVFFTGKFLLFHNFLETVDPSLIIYSLFNGFYEEIFFLGICLSVKEKHLKWALMFSLLVRFAFHTYQGMENAFAIGIIMGLLFYIIFKKVVKEELAPFFLAHALGDIFGITILWYLLY